MARIFQNVSPFGDLQVFGRWIKSGEDCITRTAAEAEGLAAQPLHWLERIAEPIKKATKKVADTE